MNRMNSLAISIRFIHLCVVMFVILGSFTFKKPIELLLYIVIVACIMLHWIVGDKTCVLTLAESYFTGKPINKTFVASLIDPIYSVTATEIKCFTFLFFAIAIVRLYQKFLVYRSQNKQNKQHKQQSKFQYINHFFLSFQTFD